MLCPYCLKDVKFQIVGDTDDNLSDDEIQSVLKEPDKDSGDVFGGQSRSELRNNDNPFERRERFDDLYVGRCSNKNCNGKVPVGYVKGYEQYPPVIFTAAGNTGHGKTAYLRSLLYLLSFGHLAPSWPNFHCTPLNDYSSEEVRKSILAFEGGALPEPTQKIIPKPVFLRLANIPTHKDSTLVIFDSPGEFWTSGKAIGRQVRFVSRAQNWIYVISIPKLRSHGKKILISMDNLMNHYINAMEGMLGNTHKQDLRIVLTMVDELRDVHTEWPMLWQHICDDSLVGLRSISKYKYDSHLVSQLVSVYLAKGLNAMQVISKARNKFRSVQFFMVSALGISPDEVSTQMKVKPNPCRVIDPLLACLPLED